MPLIELKLPEGRLDDDEIEQLTTDLTEAASAAEGSDPEKAAPLTWALVDTYSPQEWRVGGQPADGPMYVVRANVVDELVDDDGKQRFVELATDAIAEVDPEYDPNAVWVVLNGVSDGNWGAAGGIASSAQVASLIDADLAGSEPSATQD